MADETPSLNPPSPAKQFLIGFVHPELFGAYVLIAILSAVVGGACYLGFGCVFRVGGLLFLFFLPAVAVALLLVIFGGWLQAWLWRGPLKQNQPGVRRLPLFESFWRTLTVAIVGLIGSVLLGGHFCDAKAQKICADADLLIASIEVTQKQQGNYPTNIIDLVKSQTALRRKYRFYYGDSTTNGVDWEPRHIANADISFFITTNRFQCVVPIERMSPITFSSFQVYSYSSQHPSWNRTLLHWSLLGAYIDEPVK